MEPVSALCVGLLVNVVAARVDRHVIDGLILDQHVNHDIRRALRESWSQAVERLVDLYRSSPEYSTLPPQTQALVGERRKHLAASSTADDLFLADANETSSLVGDDAGHFLMPDARAVNRKLLAALQHSWLWDGLPGHCSVYSLTACSMASSSILLRTPSSAIPRRGTRSFSNS